MIYESNLLIKGYKIFFSIGVDCRVIPPDILIEIIMSITKSIRFLVTCFPALDNSEITISFNLFPHQTQITVIDVIDPTAPIKSFPANHFFKVNILY